MIATGAMQQVNVQSLGFGGEAICAQDRDLPVEVPVALEYCGLGYAVMMASPDHLEDFVIGHALSEGLAAAVDEVSGVDVAEVDGGWIVRANLPEKARALLYARARNRVSESSCGLCGIESIAEALRILPQVRGHMKVARSAIASALEELRAHQPLNAATGAVHAAAFCNADGELLEVREDVGRHNALDKLIGAIASKGCDRSLGFILLTARCSFELVEKTVRAGIPMLVTISAPTSLAVSRARLAGLTLVALARRDSALIMNDPCGSLS